MPENPKLQLSSFIKMRQTQERRQSSTNSIAKNLEFTTTAASERRRAMVLVYLLAILMCMSTEAQGNILPEAAPFMDMSIEAQGLIVPEEASSMGMMSSEEQAQILQEAAAPSMVTSTESQDQILREAQGQILPEAQRQILPEAQRQILPEAAAPSMVMSTESQGQILPEAQGQILPEAQGQILPEAAAPSVVDKVGSSNISAMFIMGDSSVDCGENTLFYPLLHQNRSLLPCDGSDSTLIPHLLAKKMGLPNPSPFYQQNGSIEEISRGLNYGSAQALIMNPGGLVLQSLNQQLRQVLETLQLLHLQLSEDVAQQFIKSSIFYLSFGKDDYVNLFLGNASDEMHNYSGQEFAHILVSQMAHAIRNLYVANVRKIVCVGILPLGCSPHLRWELQDLAAVFGGSGCVEEIDEVVLSYNTMLEELIVELNTELFDAEIVFCDVYQGIMEIITNPAYYGFDDAKTACCGLGLHSASIGCLSLDMACSESSAHVWWDLYNPTPAVNSLLADSAWTGHGLSGICRPMTVQDLVYTSV